MNCIDLMSKRSKIAKLQTRSNYDEFASIWHQNYKKCWGTSQNIQNNAKLQNWSNYNELHRFDVTTIKTTQNYKTDQITMNCIDLMSKRSKIAKIQKKSNYDQFASIWRQNDQKCWNTSQNIQNNAKLRKWSNYNDLHRFDVKTIKNVEVRHKTFKTRQNYKTDQIIMHCINLTSKRSKCWVTSQNYKTDQITMNCIDLISKRSKQR